MKHKVVICCGTTCYLSVGNRFESLEELIKTNFGDKVDLSPSACLGQCMKRHNNPELIPPFAKIDGEILSNATDENIIKALKNLDI